MHTHSPYPWENAGKLHASYLLCANMASGFCKPLQANRLRPLKGLCSETAGHRPMLSRLNSEWAYARTRNGIFLPYKAL